MTSDPSHPAGVPELVPARMLNEYTYCPRLCYLEWVQGEFAHSADTLDGRFQHRRVDQPSGDLPARDGKTDGAEADDGQPERIHARSVMLADEELGAIARIDLVETEGTARRRLTTSAGPCPTFPATCMTRSGCSCACRGCCCAPTATSAGRA